MITVGDIVEVRSFHDMAERYGVDGEGDIDPGGSIPCFTKEMKELCGKQFVITMINDDGENRLVLGHNSPFSICEYMLKEPEKIDYSKVIFLRNEWVPGIGQTVCIRDWDDMADEYGYAGGNINCKFSFVGAMKYLCGKEFTIKEFHDHRYKFDSTDYDISQFAISKDMIEPVSWSEVRAKVRQIAFDTTNVDEFLCGVMVI